MGEKRNAYRLLVGKPERRRRLRKPRRKWLDNIRMDLVEVGWGDVDWLRIGTDEELLRIGIEPSGSMKCWEAIKCTNSSGSLE
jgi:hypothetical protein